MPKHVQKNVDKIQVDNTRGMLFLREMNAMHVIGPPFLRGCTHVSLVQVRLLGDMDTTLLGGHYFQYRGRSIASNNTTAKIYENDTTGPVTVIFRNFKISGYAKSWNLNF